MRRPFGEVQMPRLVIVGFPRGGTLYMARILQELGVDVGHQDVWDTEVNFKRKLKIHNERREKQHQPPVDRIPAREVEVSWMAAYDAEAIIHARVPVVLALRDPTKILRSLWRVESDGGWRRKHVSGLFYHGDIVPEIRDREDASEVPDESDIWPLGLEPHEWSLFRIMAFMYSHWRRLRMFRPVLTVPVERLDEGLLQQIVAAAGRPVLSRDDIMRALATVPRNTNTFGAEPPPLSGQCDFNGEFRRMHSLWSRL